MFLDYYQLSEQPFDPASPPAQVYQSHAHREALESLQKLPVGRLWQSGNPR